MTIEEFFNEAMKNESLMREIDKAGDENRLARLLQERQVDGTEQQFLDFVKEKRRESHELSDDELEGASGGGCCSMKRGYMSGGTPMFKVGDHVIIEKTRYFWEDRYGATITGIDPEKSHGEFTYSIKYDDGDTENTIYESQMLRRDTKGNWVVYTSLK